VDPVGDGWVVRPDDTRIGHRIRFAIQSDLDNGILALAIELSNQSSSGRGITHQHGPDVLSSEGGPTHTQQGRGHSFAFTLRGYSNEAGFPHCDWARGPGIGVHAPNQERPKDLPVAPMLHKMKQNRRSMEANGKQDQY
jgi:hypothetical protein